MPNIRFDLTTLSIFAAVVRDGSISAAAERSNIAVSAVSKRISDLEATLGAQLLHRLSRGVEPTPAGSAVLHHAATIMHTLEQLESDLSEYVKGLKGHVRMLVNMSSIVQFLPEDLKAFSHEYPDIKIDLREANSSEVISGVEHGKADIGIFTGGLDVPHGMHARAYRQDRLALIVPRDHHLAERSNVPFADVLDEDIVGLDVGSASYAVLDNAAKALGRPLRLRYRLSGFDAVCRMIHAGLGVGIAPPAMLGAFTIGASLVGVRLDEAWADRQLMILTRDLGALPVSARLMMKHLSRSAEMESGHHPCPT